MAFLSDAEFAERYGNVAPPSSTFVSDDEMLRRYGSVAEQARARLASRGLTPEAIKANPDVAVVPTKSMLGYMAEPENTTGQPGLLDYLAAAGESTLGMIPTQAPTAANLPGMAINMAGDFAQRYVQADADFADDPVRRGIQKTAAAIPFVGGTIHDLLQPSFVAGDREPTPDERLNAMGAAVEAGALAAPAGLKGSLAKGGRVAANAEAAYAKAVDAPLTESIGQMMDRRMVVGDPRKLATRAARAADEANAVKADLIRNNPPPERWRSTPERREVARQVRSAEAEAKFQGDVQAIADGITKSKQPSGNILTGIVKTGATNAVMSAVGVPSMIGKGASMVRSLLSDLPATRAFKTASAIAKREFGKAMSAGNEALAAEIGAAIATGAAATDDFGHRSAIQSLAKEAEAAGSPELRRQVVASKRGFYTDPDGRSIEIPRGVMSAMLEAKEVNEASSPVALWLGAMKKQGKVKGGGSLSFGDTPRLQASGSEQAGSVGLPNSAIRSGAGRNRNAAAEWPANSSALDENHGLFINTNPASLLPERFKSARAITWGSPLSGQVSDNVPGAPSDVLGIFGDSFSDPRKPYGSPDYDNTVLIDKRAAYSPSIAAHEAWHGLYEKDLTPSERSQWEQFYASEINALRQRMQAAGVGPNSPPQQLSAVLATVPKAVRHYLREPTRLQETFAELGAQFMLNPTAFRSAYPTWYGYFKGLTGKEYASPK